jgi:small subunit ribosomal protein S20
VANIKSAIKRAKTSEQKRQHNVMLRSRVRTAIKKVISAADEGDAAKANELYKTAVPEIDGMVSKGLLHRNKADRTKSRLNKRVKNLSA